MDFGLPEPRTGRSHTSLKWKSAKYCTSVLDLLDCAFLYIYVHPAAAKAAAKESAIERMPMHTDSVIGKRALFGTARCHVLWMISDGRRTHLRPASISGSHRGDSGIEIRRGFCLLGKHKEKTLSLFEGNSGSCTARMKHSRISIQYLRARRERRHEQVHILLNFVWGTGFVNCQASFLSVN